MSLVYIEMYNIQELVMQIFERGMCEIFRELLWVLNLLQVRHLFVV